MQNFLSNAHQFESSQTDTRRLGLWVTIIALVFVAAPATYPGYWQSVEGFVPIFNAAQSRPIADIATLPDFWRGMGSATFLLTQPLLSLADLVALELQKTTAVRLTFILAILMGVLGIYAWLLPKFGDRAAGLGASLYALFPPFLTTIYERGSLSDALIMGLFPIALMGASSCKRTQSISGLGALFISILWMWRVQAGMALLATILLLLYVGIVEQDWRGALGTIVGGALGLATWFLFGNISTPPTASFAENFVPFYQLLLNRLLPTNSEMMAQATFQPAVINLGFAVLGLVILTLWYWRFGYTMQREETQAQLDDMSLSSPSLTRLLWFSLIGCVLLVSCSLAFSNPLWQATGANRLLTYPFQTVLLSAPFWAMLASSLLVMNRSFTHTPYWLVLILITLLNGAPYLLPNYTQIAPADQPFAMVGSGYDMVVLDATLTEDFTQPSDDEQANQTTAFLWPATEISNPPEAILEVTWQTLHTPEFDYNVFFQALMVDGDEMTVLTQIDVQPMEGQRPATTWLPGEILTDRYRLDLSGLPQQANGESADESSGKSAGESIELRYYFGYYDWREGGARQPIRLGDSQEVDDKLTFYGQQ